MVKRKILKFPSRHKSFCSLGLLGELVKQSHAMSINTLVKQPAKLPNTLNFITLYLTIHSTIKGLRQTPLYYNDPSQRPTDDVTTESEEQTTARPELYVNTVTSHKIILVRAGKFTVHCTVLWILCKSDCFDLLNNYKYVATSSLTDNELLVKLWSLILYI